MRVLVLGASGMLGNAMIRILSEKKDWEVFGTIRSDRVKRFFSPEIADHLVIGGDVENIDSLINIFGEVKPAVVINCIGLIKQLADADDPLLALPINAILPHRLARLCKVAGARFIHVSTDCVFSGAGKGYTEDDIPDATDLYGRSKLLGEVHYKNAVTLRTSIIGHELQSCHGLIDWFLSQHGQCKGYSRAFFSGLPTVAFAEIVRDVIIPQQGLSGLYHVAANSISKLDLLRLVAEIYGKSIEIIPDDNLVIDRSLNSDRFQAATGYVAPAWPELIRKMHSHQ